MTRVGLSLNRQGIDRYFAPLAGGSAFPVEFKSDSRAAETGNFCAEVESVAGMKEGWGLTARAALLVYYIPPRCVAYEVDMDRFRRSIPAWADHYPTKAAHNFGYDTLNVVVPLTQLATLARRARLVPPSGDVNTDATGQLEVRTGDGWEVPTWATGICGDVSWSALEARLEAAQHIRPGLRWRVRT